MSTERERDWVKDILLKNRLFFPTRLSFNDPFDCRIPLTWEGVTPEDLERKLSDISKRNPPTESKESVGRQIKELRKTVNIAEYVRSKEGKTVGELDLDLIGVRILCLCERPDGILMWSHYAKNHEGVCVEFNNLKGSYFAKALPVNYAEDYPKLKITDGHKEVFAGVVLTKAALWEYEQEWRVLTRKPDGFYAFPEKCLSGVILGCQISSPNENLITEWLTQRSSPVSLYRAVKAEDKFAVRIEKIRDIGPPLM